MAIFLIIDMILTAGNKYEFGLKRIRKVAYVIGEKFLYQALTKKHTVFSINKITT